MPLQEVSSVFVESDEPFDCGHTRPIQSLVRVEHQDPPATGARDGAIAGGRKIDDPEIERDHLRPIAGRDSWRSIGRTGVDENQLAGQISHRIETPRQIALFVLHHHAEADCIRHTSVISAVKAPALGSIVDEAIPLQERDRGARSVLRGQLDIAGKASFDELPAGNGAGQRIVQIGAEAFKNRDGQFRFG